MQIKQTFNDNKMFGDSLSQKQWRRDNFILQRRGGINKQYKFEVYTHKICTGNVNETPIFVRISFTLSHYHSRGLLPLTAPALKCPVGYF